MSNPLVDFPKYIKIFEVYIGRKIYLIFAFTIFSGLSEGFGLLLLLPLIQGIGNGNKELDQSLINTLLINLIDFFGLDQSVITICLFIIVAFLLKGLMNFLALGTNAYLRGQLHSDLKARLFHCFLMMRYKYYLSNDTGNFVNIINEQINRSMIAFNNLNLVGVKLINCSTFLILACFSSLRFGVIAIFCTIVFLVFFSFIGKYVKKLSRRTALENGKLSNLLIQILQAFKYLKATGQSVALQDSILSSINRLSSYQKRTGIANAFTAAVREPLVVIFIFSIIIIEVGIYKNEITPLLVSIVLLYKGLVASLGIQGNFQNTLEYIGSIEIVNDEFIRQQENQESRKGEFKGTLNKGIRLSNVCFSYNSLEENTINCVSMFFPARSSIALVGESGAGKSTIVDILTLINKPTKGNLYIDEVNSANIDLQYWRNQIGFVSQDTVIFDDTIANNISLWNINNLSKDIYFDKVRAAAQKAYLSKFIDSLPRGYETIVGERGVRLSGGQKQRLFLARELFREPKLLILDEATSSLDSISEIEIQKSINSLKGKITIIIIAHRLSTIKNVDYLYYLDHGKIIEEGTYGNLINDINSSFYKLANLQEL